MGSAGAMEVEGGFLGARALPVVDRGTTSVSFFTDFLLVFRFATSLRYQNLAQISMEALR